ncbi:MAG: polysaccharide deacetylase family protein [bacterium]|nr:polysaccharide deacetylase family protein [bacterium]
MQNLLTFDLEDWYHGNFLDMDEEISPKNDRVVEPANRILELLETTANKATFFVLGCVAERYPDLIKKIHNQGHEIASHGYNHRLVYKITPDEFSSDLQKSLDVLQQITNEKVIGYRAPYWSIYPEMDWAWKILAQHGIEYDSSVYPFRTYLYGDNRAPRFKHHFSVNGFGNIVEIPPTVAKIAKKRIPFCGGFYFRLLPYRIVKILINRINLREKQPIVFYLHPYEIDYSKTKSSRGMKNNFILHVNVKKARAKLSRLLTEFQFNSIKYFLSKQF